MTSPPDTGSGWAQWVPRGLSALTIVLGAIASLASQFGWVGSWVNAFGVALVIFGTVVLLWNMLAAPTLDSRQKRRRLAREKQEKIRSIVSVDPGIVAEIDLYQIGVFKSDLADQSSKSAKPPYIPRTIEAILDDAFDEEALVRNERLVVVRGDPKSGKSRTLGEALRRNTPHRTLVALRPPLTADINSPAHKPLATLLDAEIEAPSEGLVVWIDDAHAHTGYGLTRDNLRRLIEAHPTIVIALTVHSHELEEIKEFEEPLERLLRSASSGLILSTRFDEGEVVRARSGYPSLADDDRIAWLPELFAAVNLLRDRYRDSGVREPEGVAIVKAAIDWNRAGMPRTVAEQTLLELAAVNLREVAPARELSNERFARGLKWATGEVAARSALLLRSSTGEEPAFYAFDAVASWAPIVDGPLHDKCWLFVLERVDSTTGNRVGMAARVAGRAADAEAAFRHALASSNSRTSNLASLHIGYLHGEADEVDDAIEMVRPVLDASEQDLVSMAALMLGSLLMLKGQFVDAAETLQQALNSPEPSHVDYAEFYLGMAFKAQDRPEDAIEAFQKAVNSSEPNLAGKAALQLAAVFRDQGQVVDAIDAFEKALISRDPDVVDDAAVYLGIAYKILDRPEDAIDACQQALNSSDPTIIDTATLLLGSLYAEQEQFEAATHAYERALNSLDPATVDRANTALRDIANR